jgi:hypothetical protein
VQALRFEAVGDSGQTYGGRAFRDCMTAARLRHVRVMLVRRGMHHETDDGVALDGRIDERSEARPPDGALYHAPTTSRRQRSSSGLGTLPPV